METITVTNIDGSQAELQSNSDVICHGVDADGNYLGLVPHSEAFFVVNAPPAGTWRWDFQAKQWQRIFTLQELQDTRWEQIKADRDAEEQGGFDTPFGRFDSDDVSQTKIIGAVTAAGILGAGFSIVWTLQNNDTVTLDATQMVQVGMTLMAHVDSTHQRGENLRASIRAAASQQDLEAITWQSS